MKILLLLTTLLFCVSAHSYEQIFKLSSLVFDNSEVKFKPHTNGGRYGSYLSMSINFPPVQELYLDFKRSYRKKLKNRGEAHVTTITPVEYFQVLKDKVSIEEINDIALDHRIQESDLNIICLGSGHKGNLDTFFVVVESQNLLKIRKAVDELFEARGGNPRAFSPEDFYPHITLGFNKRDLHESDGVIKDGSSCIYNIVVQ